MDCYMKSSFAIDDGMLVDVTDFAKRVGFSCRVAVTSVLWNEVLVPAAELRLTQDITVRLVDLLCKLRESTEFDKVGSEHSFSLLYQMSDQVLANVFFLARHSLGEKGQPVIVIMVSGEE